MQQFGKLHRNAARVWLVTHFIKSLKYRACDFEMFKTNIYFLFSINIFSIKRAEKYTIVASNSYLCNSFVNSFGKYVAKLV